MRVLLTGATGSIGRGGGVACGGDGDRVMALVRPGGLARAQATLPAGVECRECDVLRADDVLARGIAGDGFDAVMSCLASRTGAPRDAWAVDRDAQLALLSAAKRAGIAQFVLLSAICVQKPRLQFQFAKLEAERAVQASGLRYSIVRPTAFFKSLSGQVQRVKQGKPFLLFGDGSLTACKPISDADCARFLASCLDDPARWDRVLPIGGPGPALTLREQGELLFSLTGRVPRFRSVSPTLLSGAGVMLGALGRVIPPLADRAEFARIGHYYATESMLVWNAAQNRYDAEATPEFGSDTLREHYARLIRGDVADDRGAHAVF
jgi:divinyl chlorophyllide a 8-vinyl-reductase